MLQTKSWILTNQTVPGHYELGLFNGQIVETEQGDIFLIGEQYRYSFLGSNF